jgi:hypothetical protein
MAMWPFNEALNGFAASLFRRTEGYSRPRALTGCNGASSARARGSNRVGCDRQPGVCLGRHDRIGVLRGAARQLAGTDQVQQFGQPWPTVAAPAIENWLSEPQPPISAGTEDQPALGRGKAVEHEAQARA